MSNRFEIETNLSDYVENWLNQKRLPKQKEKTLTQLIELNPDITVCRDLKGTLHTFTLTEEEKRHSQIIPISPTDLSIQSILYKFNGDLIDSQNQIDIASLHNEFASIEPCKMIEDEFERYRFLRHLYIGIVLFLTWKKASIIEQAQIGNHVTDFCNKKDDNKEAFSSGLEKFEQFLMSY